jgi:hypothetical protein
MKIGSFNINDYLERLYEGSEQKEQKQTGFGDGGENLTNSDGIVIPSENKKSFEWLKKEFQKGKTEVKVEMKIGGSKFEPGYDMQTKLDSVKDFKPGMYGEVRTGESEKKSEPKHNLEAKKSSPNFTKGEGDKEKKELPKTNSKGGDIKNKNVKDVKKEDVKKKETFQKKEDTEEPAVKKIDLKTKKK